MRKTASGFTIIEILVVIAVIAILTAISVVTFSRYQSNSRDSQRVSRATIITEALEKYYNKNGEYPSCGALTGTAVSVSSGALSGIDTTALIAPKAASGDTNSIRCQDLTNAATDPDIFAYIGDGSAACTGAGSCLQYTVKYKDETDGTIKTLNSRHNTNIATSGNTSITSISATGFTQIDVGWSAVTNASSYNLQRATDSGFTANLVTTYPTITSTSVSGLVYGTTYYFRVAPNAPGSQGAWSAAASAATWSLTTPVVTSTVTTNSFTGSWSAISHASTYTAQCSADNANWSGCVAAGLTSPTYTFTGAVSGMLYYIRVQAVSGAYTSSWSTSVTATTVINPPSVPTIATTLPSSTVARGTASASTCASGTLEYQIRYNSTKTATDGAWSGWTVGTTQDQTGIYQGNKYTFQAQARCIGPNVSSTFTTSGSTTSTFTGIDTPPAPTWAIPTEWAAGYNYTMYYGWSCPASTDIGPEGVVSNYNGGADRSTPWVDWWYVGWNSGNYESYRTYYGKYRCYTAYTQTYTATTGTTVHVYCDPSRRSFSSYPRCDNYGQGQAGNGTGN